MSRFQPKPEQIKWMKAVLFALCLTPLLVLVWRAFNARLGANPIEFVERSTGWWTLALLMITLSVTPLRRWLDAPWLLRLRRMLGLFAFFYACMHFGTWLIIDQFFDWHAIVKDIAKRPY